MDTERRPLKQSLIEAEDCVLVVIDMQDSFLEKYEKEKRRLVVSRAAWLIRAAQTIGMPIVAMAEDMQTTGPLNADILSALPAGASVFDKHCFGCGDQADILNAIQETGRRTAVLIGMETDVCVAQSALSLMAHGFEVAVVREAVISTAADEDVGLMRIRDAGGVIFSVKSIYFEWLRGVAAWKQLRLQNDALETLELPPTITL